VNTKFFKRIGAICLLLSLNGADAMQAG
jgi:hypothetical protein